MQRHLSVEIHPILADRPPEAKPGPHGPDLADGGPRQHARFTPPAFAFGGAGGDIRSVYGIMARIHPAGRGRAALPRRRRQGRQRRRTLHPPYEELLIRATLASAFTYSWVPPSSKESYHSYLTLCRRSV